MAQKIEVVRGTTNIFNITVTNAEDGIYELLSGEKLLFGVKKNPEKEVDPIISKTVTAITDGVYVVTIDPEDTASLAFGKYFYDVGLESGSKFYNIIEASPFFVQPNVTKRGDGA